MAPPRLLNARLMLPLLVAAWLTLAQPPATADTRPALPRTAAAAEAVIPTVDVLPAWDAPQGPLEERLFGDAADGRLDALSPFEAALIAGGVDRAEELDRYAQKAAALVEQFQQSNWPSDPKAMAPAILAFLHGHVLRGGYDLACTDLRRVLDEGRFNCVSATVLFDYVASRVGLACCGLEMPGHAMSRVRLADGSLDVETTSPRGIPSRGTRPAAHASPALGAAVLVDPLTAREVSPIQLAAMIYYNRGVDLLAEKRFEEAARANAKAVRLDPQNATARGNLLATLNNWAIALGDAGKFPKAAALLRQGRDLDPNFEPCVHNFVHVHRQWVDELCRQQRFDDALGVLDRAIAEMPEGDFLRKTQHHVHQRAQAIARPAELAL